MNSLFDEKAGGAKAGAVFSVAVCLYVVINLIVSLFIEEAGISGDAMIYLSYICSPVAIIITLALCAKFLNTPLRLSAPLKCSPKYFLISVLCIFGLLFAVSPLNSLFLEFLTYCGYTPSDSLLPDFGGWGMLAGILIIGLLPALCEELLFRGAVLYNTVAGTGTVSAIFLTGFIFCLYHGSIEQTIYQFVCGCMFALLAVRSGSVLPSMLAHFLNNGVIIVLQGLSLLDESGNLIMPQWASIVVTVLAVLSLAGALVWLIFDKKQLIRGEGGEVKKFFIFGSVGILIMALIWILGLLTV